MLRIELQSVRQRCSQLGQLCSMLAGKACTLIPALVIALSLNLFEEKLRAQVTFGLRLVGSYGVADLDPDSTYGLSRMELSAGGPALGEPVAVTVAPDGTVFVLDRKFFKIVVFEDGGRVRRVILGGSGRGPGEFLHPTWMAAGPSGNLFVLDPYLARVTEFTPAGDRVRVISITSVVPGGLAVSATDSLWLVEWSRSAAEYAVALVDFSGNLRSRSFKTTSRDRTFADFGALPVIGLIRGRLHMAPGQPGQWSVLGSERLGREFFPALEPKFVPRPQGQMRVVPAITRAIVGLSQGRIGLIYTEFRPLTPVEEMRSHNWLAIYDSAGGLRGRIEIPGADKLTAAAVSADGRHLYVNQSDPYPRILKYELIEATGGNR